MVEAALMRDLINSISKIELKQSEQWNQNSNYNIDPQNSDEAKNNVIERIVDMLEYKVENDKRPWNNGMYEQVLQSLRTQTNQQWRFNRYG